MRNRWGVPRLSVGVFLSHSAEGLRGEAFCTAENLSFENIYSLGWYYDSPEKCYG